MANIIALYVWRFSWSTELLGKVDFSVFTRLRDVAIRCEFPKANIKKCLKMMKAVCGPSLTCLDLDLFLEDDAPPLEPRYFAQILRQIAETCPNLIEFGIGIPDPKLHPVTPIMTALNSIRFPKLTYLDLCYGGESGTPAGLEVNWDQFLLNHPTVESFKYCSHSKAIPDNAFPHLRKYQGAFIDRTVLSLGTYRLLSNLVMWLFSAFTNDEVYEFRDILKEMPNLRNLTLNEDTWIGEWGDHGLLGSTFVELLEACPKLTYLKCHISWTCPVELIYLYISGSCGLPCIERLLLTIYIPNLHQVVDSPNIDRCPMKLVKFEWDKMMSPLCFPNLNKLHSLHTIELDIYGWLYEVETTEPPPWNGVLSFEMVEKNGRREPELIGFK
ncbi:hypothetical protein BT96DRAFT_970683 [Gymnopus androsaceus JB14]|uniref:F-box domain-containing protein n=1 Tax=Gymnopus androsaceus JB14 TaxID=1447944 RepID=A0A6A4ICG5_9AGAR|nr:hypothetical protein BT96DRAFT_970683 [Gymnopus androsaceus JB14]